MQTIIDYFLANEKAILLIQQSGFAAAAAVFQLIGMPKASKLCGTFTALDLGRIVRFIKLRVALISAALCVGFLLLLGGCSVFSPHPSTPCAGLYCLSASLPGVPGSAKLCYDTDAQRLAAKAQLESEGRKVTVLQ